MSLKQEAEGAPYYLTTDIGRTPLYRFWVVLLDCGFEVYQNYRDGNLELPNPWSRLKQFCKDKNVKIVNMAVANRVPDPNTQINLTPVSDGYFFAERFRKILFGLPMSTGFEDQSIGVGELHGDELTIYWEVLGHGLEIEKRSLIKDGTPYSLIKQ